MWNEGLTWTDGEWTNTTNPDGTVIRMKVHGGPFYWSPSLFGRKVPVLFLEKVTFRKYRPVIRWKHVYVYIGFRPTPANAAGYGDEGIISGASRWLKKVNWGNFGAALRFKDIVSN